MPRNKKSEHSLPDPIRETLARRADQLGLSPYEIASMMGIDPGTVKRFLHGMNRPEGRRHISLNSRYVSQMLRILGLEIRPKKTWKKRSE